MMLRNASAYAIALFALSACNYSHSIDTSLISGVEFRAKYGVTREIDTDDPEYQELLRYLESNRDGWVRHTALIPNADVAFSADQFVLYIADDSVYLQERGEKLLVKDLGEIQ